MKSEFVHQDAHKEPRVFRSKVKTRTPHAVLKSSVSKWILRSGLGGLRLALGVLLLWLVMRNGASWQLMGRLFQSPQVLVPLLALPFVGVIFEAARLKLLLGPIGVGMTLGRAYRLVAIGSFFNLAIPGGTGGDFVKLYFVGTANREKVAEVASVFAVDRAIALFSLLIMIVLLALFDAQLVRGHAVIAWLVGGAAFLAVLMLCIALSARHWRAGRVVQATLARMPWRQLITRFLTALMMFRGKTRLLFLACLVSMFGHLALIAMFMLAGSLFVPEGSGVTVALLSLLGMLANALPITPGGLGVGEAAAAQIFSTIGSSSGATLILAWRIGTFPLCGFGCLSYVANWR